MDAHIAFAKLKDSKNQLLRLFRDANNLEAFNATNRIFDAGIDEQAKEYKNLLDHILNIEDEYKELTGIE
ncbi:MAG: hypothetical protein PHC99_10145 [Methylococcales bacterium]|nr:hypothetical protein [Methylococcales bacterium]